MSARRVAVISGANRGIGKETARQLAGRGVTVLLGSRDVERGLRAARELSAQRISVVPVQLDVTELDSVRALASLVERDYGHLDILVNNAGVTSDRHNLDTDDAVLTRVLEVNVVGAVRLIHLLLPLLRESESPRIVNVSSATASLALTDSATPLPGDAERRLAYAGSKAALNMLTVQYARAFRRERALSHIKINSASPGYTATDMNNHRGTRDVATGARVIVDLALSADDGPTGGFFDDSGRLPW
ncbi:SDR family NAD(P)-dependent oxidoreductase [Nocardia takedensis]